MKRTHTRSVHLPYTWPTPSIQIALVEPEIPPNTGNIARLCAATNSPLHLVEPLGFSLSDSAVKRAGLDYWDSVDVRVHASVEHFLDDQPPPSMYFFSTGAKKSYLEADYKPGDLLVFGSETQGLPQALLDQYPEQVYGIPMQIEHVRSLNLANTASIVLYEALRQQQTV